MKYVPHLATVHVVKHEHPYCCECDFCYTDGIKCEGPALMLTLEPYENDYVLFCHNHIASAMLAVHRVMLEHPERQPAHEVYDKHYVAGHMPPGTGWVDE